MSVRYFIIFLIVFFSKLSVQGQIVSPWESVAPPGTPVFTDLKTAIKEAQVCYRLELSGTEFLKDKKVLPKANTLHQLIALRLVNNNLKELPPVFLNFQSLKYFYSTGNPFTSFSDSLGMWSELRFMELNGTNFDTLPEGIYGCGRLQSLSISSNTDTLKISKGIISLNKMLTELRISKTILDTLPVELSEMSKMSKLVFYKCGLKEMPQPVLKMNLLKELWLDSNSISNLPRAISGMQGLTYLSLKGNRISYIPSDICFLQNLAVLDLRGNPIDPYEIHVLQALLPSCRILF